MFIRFSDWEIHGGNFKRQLGIISFEHANHFILAFLDGKFAILDTPSNELFSIKKSSIEGFYGLKVFYFEIKTTDIIESSNIGAKLVHVHFFIIAISIQM